MYLLRVSVTGCECALVCAPATKNIIELVMLYIWYLSLMVNTSDCGWVYSCARVSSVCMCVCVCLLCIAQVMLYVYMCVLVQVSGSLCMGMCVCVRVSIARCVSVCGCGCGCGWMGVCVCKEDMLLNRVISFYKSLILICIFLILAFGMCI